ncbi:MAG: PadR family transcriptional regulator [Firmicutes bacterium]|nr:PadR family transcriptional regulator [Bacillota bacterium]
MDAAGEWNSQLRRGLLELCILALIEKGPIYGYQIISRLAGTPELAAGEGTIYPLLRRLRKEGLAESYWQTSEEGPPRNYYSLTASGRKALSAMRAEWMKMAAAVDRYAGPGRHADHTQDAGNNGTEGADGE